MRRRATVTVSAETARTVKSAEPTRRTCPAKSVFSMYIVIGGADRI
jgi:hypothetical protein